MTEPLTPMELDSAFANEADFRLLNMSETAKKTRDKAPLPNSAYRFADRLLGAELISLSGSIEKAAKPPTSRLTQPLSLMNGTLLQQRPSLASDTALLGPLAPFMLGTTKTLQWMGELTPEQSDQAAAENLARAETRVDAIESKIETRRRLRELSPEGAAELFGVNSDIMKAADAAPKQAETEAGARLDKAVMERNLAAMAVEGLIAKPEQAWWLNAYNSYFRGMYGMVTGAARGTGAYWELAKAAVSGDDVEKSRLREASDEVDKRIEKLFPQDNGRTREIVTHLSQGFGSATTFLLGGMVSSTMGPLLGVATRYGLPVLAQGGAGYVDAERHAATYFQKWVGLIANSALGATEMIPINRAFGRLATEQNPGLFLRLLHNSGAQSIEEFAQEAGQSLGEDFVARFSYDPTREIDVEQALYQGMIGGIVGAGIGGGMTLGFKDNSLGLSSPADRMFDRETRQRIGETAQQLLGTQIELTLNALEHEVGTSAAASPGGAANPQRIDGPAVATDTETVVPPQVDGAPSPVSAPAIPPGDEPVPFEQFSEIVPEGSREMLAVHLGDKTWEETAPARQREIIAEFIAARPAAPASDPAILAQAGRPKGEITRPPEGIAEAAVPPAPATDIHSLSEMATQFKRLMNVVVRQGRLAKREFLGQYNVNTELARVRSVNDLSTIVHEAGHHLQKTAADPVAAFIGANGGDLARIAETYYPGDTSGMAPDLRVAEGFAEFFRLYVTNRQEAASVAPALTTAFKEVLDRTDQRVSAALDAIGHRLFVLMHLPSTQFVGSFVVSSKYEGAAAVLKERVGEEGLIPFLQQLQRDMVTAAANKFRPIATIVDEMLNTYQASTGKAMELPRAYDPYTLARLMGKSAQGAWVQIRDGVTGFRSHDAVSPGLRSAILRSQGLRDNANPAAWNETRLDDFNNYLAARAAFAEYKRQERLPPEQRMKRDPVGFTRGDAWTAITDFEARYNTDFTEAADMVHQYALALWDKAYEAGILGMTKEVWREAKALEFYAPLVRDMSDRGGVFETGKRRGGPPRLVKSRKGSDRDIVAPLETLMKKTFAVERAIAENEVVRALAVMADRIPGVGALVSREKAHETAGQGFSVEEVAKAITGIPDIGPTEALDLVTILQGAMDNGAFIRLFRQQQAHAAGHNVLFFAEQGKLQMIELADGKLGEDIVALVDTFGPETMGMTMSILAGTATVFRSTITSWPDFLMVNFIRDQFSSWIQTAEGYIPFLSGLKGIWHEIRQKEVARLANLQGVTMGGANTAALHEGQFNHDLDALRAKGYKATLFRERGPLGLLKGFARFTELTETATRFGLFELTYKRAKKEGLSDWEAGVEAAYVASDIIDFNLHGASKVAAARRVVPFLSAQINGWYKMLRVFGADEVSRRKGLMYALGAYFRSLDNLPLNANEKRAVRTGRLAFLKATMLGLASAAIYALYWDDPAYQEIGEEMRARYWILPVGHNEVVMIPKPHELAIIANIFERGLEASHGKDGMATSRLLRGLVSSAMPPVWPPVIQQMVEQQTNYDFFTERAIISQWDQALPPPMQYNHYTSEIAKGIGKATGMSPMKIDHLMEGLFTSAFRDLSTITNQYNASRPDMRPQDVPILRRFYRNSTRGAQSVRDFWDEAAQTGGRMHTAYEGYKNALESGNVVYANEFLASQRDEDKAYALLLTHFPVAAKRLHPMYRGRQVATVVRRLRRELGEDPGIINTDKTAEEGARIPLTGRQRRDIDLALEEIYAVEIRNTLILMGHPGWGNKKMLDTIDETKEIIRRISPETADEMNRRYAKERVYTFGTVQDNWDDLRERLLYDRDQAILDDLTALAEMEGEL